MIESLGIISMVLAVVGVLANNRRLRWCFLLWMVSNAISLAIHAQAGILSLAVRDGIFLILSFEGYWRWGNSHRGA